MSRGRSALRRIAALATVSVLVVPALFAAPAGAATKARYVGIVIAGKGSSCVRWHSGITGDAVLNAVASVQYRRSDGLIVQIDGTPSPAKADSTHYWSYWHDTSGSWSYSNLGASSYQPKAGTVEGWSYDNGATSAAPPGSGAGGLYASLCGSRDAAATPTQRSSTPRAPVRSASHRATSTPRPGSTAGAGGSARTPSSTSPGQRSSGAGSSAAGSSTPAASSGTSSTPAPGPSTATAPGGSTGSPLMKPAASSSAGGSPWPVLLGVALVLLLGAAGGWGVVRRRRADAAED